MQESYQPDGEIEKIAQAGIAGMVGVVSGEILPPDVIAAWVASSQTKSSATEREEEVEALAEMLPSYIEYHRTARWLPNPHRGDH
jgi:hypothetical protein